MRIHAVLTTAACLAAPALAGLAPAAADPMDAQSAQRFVYGRTFSYNCYEGTAGAGRILEDGSVAGTIQLRGKGNVRYVALPAGTILVRGEKVCAKLKGLAFQPCFDLDKTGEQSFRGSLAGADKLWCEFKRGGSGRTRMAERTVPRRSDVATADEKQPAPEPH